jgi:hypothetical protein
MSRNLKRQISLKQVTDVAKMIHLSLLTLSDPRNSVTSAREHGRPGANHAEFDQG